MKARLIKNKDSYYLTIYKETYQEVIAHSFDGGKKRLSLKNCQAIERGYDLDELADEYGFRVPYDGTKDFYDLDAIKHYKAGFQKCLELMGDKKFTEEDVDKAVEWGITNGRLGDVTHYSIDNFIQSLQQNEWEVEILMEEVNIGDKYTPDPKPKLDADGCLILRRI